jgi:hypothetical protein
MAAALHTYPINQTVIDGTEYLFFTFIAVSSEGLELRAKIIRVKDNAFCILKVKDGFPHYLPITIIKDFEKNLANQKHRRVDTATSAGSNTSIGVAVSQIQGPVVN